MISGDWFPADLRPVGEPEVRHMPLGSPFERTPLSPESARELALSLRERAAALRALPLERILNALDCVHRDWPAEGNADEAERWVDMMGTISQAAGYHHFPVITALRHLCHSLRRPHLEGWLAAAGIRPAWLDGVLDEARTLVFGPRLTLVVSSGNIPGAALPSVVQALLLKSPVLVKTSSAEPALLPAYAAALAEVDPEVGRALVVTGWEGGDVEIEGAVLPEVDALIAYGGNAAITALRNRLPAHARFVGYGHRISFNAIGRERLNRDQFRSILDSVAVDFSYYPEGCLSPQALYVEEGGEMSPEELAERLGGTLGKHSRMPCRERTPGEISAVHQYRARVEMASFQEGGPRIWYRPDETHWTVVLDPSPELVPTPRDGILVIRAVPDLSCLPEVVGRVGPALISCGLDVAEERRLALVGALGAAGVTRFAHPGQAQFPEDPLFHDGVNALAALARFVVTEKPPQSVPE